MTYICGQTGFIILTTKLDRFNTQNWVQPVPGIPGSLQAFPTIGPPILQHRGTEQNVCSLQPACLSRERKNRINWVINTLLLFSTQHLEKSLYFHEK